MNHSLNTLMSDYKMKIRGVFHIGGNIGQEAEEYHVCGIENGIFFEPQKLPFEECLSKSKQFGYEAYNLALGNKSGKIEMNLSLIHI